MSGWRGLPSSACTACWPPPFGGDEPHLTARPEMIETASGPPLGSPVVPDVWPGEPYPLGAVWDGIGTNASLYAPEAEGVDLCLFDAAGKGDRVALTGGGRFPRA